MSGNCDGSCEEFCNESFACSPPVSYRSDRYNKCDCSTSSCLEDNTRRIRIMRALEVLEKKERLAKFKRELRQETTPEGKTNYLHREQIWLHKKKYRDAVFIHLASYHDESYLDCMGLGRADMYLLAMRNSKCVKKTLLCGNSIVIDYYLWLGISINTPVGGFRKTSKAFAVVLERDDMEIIDLFLDSPPNNPEMIDETMMTQAARSKQSNLLLPRLREFGVQ